MKNKNKDKSKTTEKIKIVEADSDKENEKVIQGPLEEAMKNNPNLKILLEG